MDSDRVKSLEMLQSIISRLAGNSFTIKGWSIGLTAAILAFAAKDSNPLLAVIAIPPVIIFWGLDAYYLGMERRYRDLWNDMRKENGGSAPYDFNVGKLPPNQWANEFANPTVLWVHGAVLLAAAGVLIYGVCKSLC